MDVLKSFIPTVARQFIMFLGSKILDIVLVLAFSVMPFGSLGNMQGSREYVGLANT